LAKSKPATRTRAKGQEARQGTKQPKEKAKTRESVAAPQPFILPTGFPFLPNWSSLHSYIFLAAATVLVLVPFSGKAFHVDDTLFLFAAKQIVKHPLDPYGFQLVWNTSVERMSDVTENPPLTCYYAALVGRIAGWSERALHLAFLLPALGLVLGTYRLGRHCTRFPLLAALAALLTPGVLVSATSVMCDTMMVAFWVWAVVLWVEGLEQLKPFYLIGSSFLIAASALTKYFGLALIPLLLVYSVIRLRRFGWWAAYFLVPIVGLIGYEMWTAGLYDHGLISGAAEFAAKQREFQQGSTLSHALVSLSFGGGCTLTALTLMPLLWSWKETLTAALFSWLAAASLIFEWVEYGTRVGGGAAARALRENGTAVDLQLTLCILSGVFILAMAIADVWTHKKDAESWLLGLWVLGTWVFAGFVNWTVNARSVLPLIPAAAILMIRRFDKRRNPLTPRRSMAAAACALAIAGVLSLSIAAADVSWANSAREAANRIYQKTRGERGTVFFLGHWGFQYYMQALGFTPADESSNFRVGDMVIVPRNNTEFVNPPQEFDFLVQEHMGVPSSELVTTMSPGLGAGFYSAYWGPLPFAFGNVPPEQYELGHLVPHRNRSTAGNQ
jgi:hypothetical protein